MKSIGIVRKMDELGRVVIPMEFRRTNGWMEGDPIGMCVTGNGDLILRKYSPLDDGSFDRLTVDLERIQGMDNGGEATAHLARALSHIKAAQMCAASESKNGGHTA